jgi:hypothetical protein
VPRALRLTDLLAGLRLFGGHDAVPPRPVQETVRAAVPLPADLAHALAALPPALAAWVRDPLGRETPPPVWTPRALALPGGGTARQVSPTTCGSAVLAMLALAGDLRLALRLARAADPASAFAAMQRRLQDAATRGPLGLPAWPRALGTPPWGAARQARYGAVRFTHRVVGSDDGALGHAVAAAAGGVPVPLYTGGDVTGGLARAVPRHVVLLTGVGEATATLYEPSSGGLHSLPLEVLLTGPIRGDARAVAARTRALGGWPHVVWTVLPVRSRPADPTMES